jgi:hypothetical protein
MDRDDFSPRVKDIVQKRAAYICSNPECRCLTVAPSRVAPERFVYIGQVSHITAAASGGPRYDPTITAEERSSPENAIHLCAVCATMIDKNQGIDFPADLLRQWKAHHEAWVTENLNKNPWLNSFRNEVKFEFVRKVVSLANQFKQEFAEATSPLTFQSESANRERRNGESREEGELLDELFARRNRLGTLQETLRQLYEASWEAEVTLGRDIGELLKPMDYTFRRLLGTVEAYFSTKLERARHGGWGNPESEVWLNSCHRMIYGIDTSLWHSVNDAVNSLIEELNVYTS